MTVPGADTYRNRVWLTAQINKPLSQEEIAALCGADHRTINRWARRHNIKTPFIHGNDRFRRLEIRLAAVGAVLKREKYTFVVTESGGTVKEFKRLLDARGYYFEGKAVVPLLVKPPQQATRSAASHWQQLRRL